MFSASVRLALFVLLLAPALVVWLVAAVWPRFRQALDEWAGKPLPRGPLAAVVIAGLVADL